MAKKAATKAKAPKKAKSAPTEAAKPSEVRHAITQSKLRSLMASKRSAQKDIDEIAGGLGSEIKAAVEKSHLNRKVFAFICSLDRMEPEKVAGTLDDLDHYLDISGLRDRAAQVQRMQFGPGEGADDDEGDQDNDNVHDFPGARGVAAE